MQKSIMTPEMPIKTLADQPWFAEFLAGKGFHRSSPDAFTNGKATLQIKGTQLVANPGTGDKAWQADFTDADPTTIRAVVEQVLKLRPFWTEQQLARERADHERLEQALDAIADTIKDGPDTHGGVQLRRFLWSLHNQHHLVNLWQMTTVLDAQRSAWVSEVFAGALVGNLKEDDLKRALQDSGEMHRWDQVQPSDHAHERLDEAESIIRQLVRTMPPSQAHTGLVSLLRKLNEVRGEWNRSAEGEP